MQQHQQRKWYSTASAAEATDFSRGFIYQQIVAGNLRATDMSGGNGRRPRYRIAAEDLEAFMRGNPVEHADEQQPEPAQATA